MEQVFVRARVDSGGVCNLVQVYNSVTASTMGSYHIQNLK